MLAQDGGEVADQLACGVGITVGVAIDVPHEDGYVVGFQRDRGGFNLRWGGPHRRRPVNDLPPALPVLHLVRRRRRPRAERLARTIHTWWSAIEAFLHTKITNAASEGYNRVVKLDARNAYGYRNPENQRLRTRCATTRRARGCLNPDQLVDPD